jgi:nucleoside-diphosphate-sugar epimerase
MRELFEVEGNDSMMNGAKLMGHDVVLGGSGFVGSHLVDALVAAGSRVTVVDNGITGNASNLEHALKSGRVDVVSADICDGALDYGPFDRLFNLACPASPKAYTQHPIETLRAGSVGTMNSLALAAKYKATYFLASTSEVYGDPLQSPQQEQYWGNVNPVGPRSMYDEAKRFSEAAVTAYGQTHDVSVRIGRIFNTYGPRMDSDDGRMIPNFITQMLAGQPLTIYGNGRQTRSLCYVSDTVKGIIAVTESEVSEPMNIGSDNELSVLELADRLSRSHGDRPLELIHSPEVKDDPQVRRPALEKIFTATNWRAEISLDEGLRETVDWFALHLRTAMEPK